MKRQSEVLAVGDFSRRTGDAPSPVLLLFFASGAKGMKRLYLSGKITGNENYKEGFLAAKVRLGKAGYGFGNDSPAGSNVA